MRKCDREIIAPQRMHVQDRERQYLKATTISHNTVKFIRANMHGATRLRNAFVCVQRRSSHLRKRTSTIREMQNENANESK